ncbi:MAG: CD225/dispanin family protein [Muribaculaceae bacterium]|nr:CD225/dispanin family protein [Muribaculaceae bacterium]
MSTKYLSGDYEGARKSSRNAEIWIIISFVLGVLSATLTLPIALIN